MRQQVCSSFYIGLRMIEMILLLSKRKHKPIGKNLELTVIVPFFNTPALQYFQLLQRAYFSMPYFQDALLPFLNLAVTMSFFNSPLQLQFCYSTFTRFNIEGLLLVIKCFTLRKIKTGERIGVIPIINSYPWQSYYDIL